MSNNFSHNDDKRQLLTMDNVRVGQSCTIVRCRLPSDIQQRLFEMGLVPGTTVTVLKKAPLGDPLEIAVRGYSLCIRAEVACRFDVTL